MREQSKDDSLAFQMYGKLVETIGQLVDACAFGMIAPESITELEFSLMRLYKRATQPRLF